MRLDSASRTDARTSPCARERFSFIIIIITGTTITFRRPASKKKKQTFFCPRHCNHFASVQTCKKPGTRQRQRGLNLLQINLPAVLWKCTQAPCQKSKRTARAPSPMSGTRSFFSAENAKQYIKAPLGGSSRLRLSWLCALSAALHQKRCCESFYNDMPHLRFFYLP